MLKFECGPVAFMFLFKLFTQEFTALHRFTGIRHGKIFILQFMERWIMFIDLLGLQAITLKR